MVDNRQCQCQSCGQNFHTQDDLDEHIETYKSRVQELMLELQQALAHVNATDNPETHDNDNSNGSGTHENDNNGEGLSCPHSECEHKPAYSRLDTLLRHYSSHTQCNLPCPSCSGKFATARTYELHLPRCLGSQSDNNRRDAALRNKRLLHRQTISNLKRRRAIPRGTSAISTEVNHEYPELTGGELVGDMNAATGLHNTNSRPFQLAPNCVEACHVQSPLMGNNVNFEFPTTYTANDNPLANRLARGPVLHDNPIQWTVACAQPLFMDAPEIGAPVPLPSGRNEDWGWEP